MLDAPVSGGTAGAQAGTLTFIVGGDEATVERARPILQAMGKNIFHVGASGAGQVAKLCNNTRTSGRAPGRCLAGRLPAAMPL
jgi:3-hydroxyisobutyrate dehydrogenase